MLCLRNDGKAQKVPHRNRRLPVQLQGDVHQVLIRQRGFPLLNRYGEVLGTVRRRRFFWGQGGGGSAPPNHSPIHWPSAGGALGVTYLEGFVAQIFGGGFTQE